MGRNHFDLDRYAQVEVVIGDALVPKGAEQDDFLLKMADLLEPGGLILFNRLMHSPVLHQQSVEFFRKMIALLRERNL